MMMQPPGLAAPGVEQPPPGTAVVDAPLSGPEEALRQTILRDVDARIEATVQNLLQAKLGEILTEGRKMVRKEQQTREESVAEVQQLASELQKSSESLELEVRHCKEESDGLKQALHVLAQQFRALVPPGSLVLPPVPDFPVTCPSSAASGPSFPATPTPGGGGDHVAASPAAPGAKLSLERALNLDTVVSCTLRKADGVDLGLDLAAVDDQGLRVQSITKDGTVDAWNRQCVGKASQRAIRPGDLIIAVNSIEGDTTRMRAECQTKQTVRFMFIHEGTEMAAAEAARSRQTRPLSANADVFVPSTPAAAGGKDAKPGNTNNKQAAVKG